MRQCKQKAKQLDATHVHVLSGHFIHLCEYTVYNGHCYLQRIATDSSQQPGAHAPAARGTHLHRICALDEFIIALKRCDVKKTRAAAHEMLNDARSAVEEAKRVGALLHDGPIGAAAHSVGFLSLVKNT